MFSPEALYAVAQRSLACITSLKRWERGGSARASMRPSTRARIERALSELCINPQRSESSPTGQDGEPFADPKTNEENSRQQSATQA
jgi:hypothetical protein